MVMWSAMRQRPCSATSQSLRSLKRVLGRRAKGAVCRISWPGSRRPWGSPPGQASVKPTAEPAPRVAHFTSS
eukprot:11162440-Lingulodinium_polyedra.AAC.1